MKSIAAARNSSSMVSMRLVSSGPVFSIFCLPTLPKWGSTVGSSRSLALQFSTPRGPNFFSKARVLRVVGILRLFLGVEVIEVAEELVEAVHGRQVLVAVAEMVLAELPGRVAEGLHEIGDGWIERREPEFGARQADLGQAGADRRLTGDEGGAAGGAALLAVPVGEDRAFLGRCGRCWACGSP